MQEIIKKYQNRQKSSINQIDMTLEEYTRIISYDIIDSNDKEIIKALDYALLDYPNNQEILFLYSFINDKLDILLINKQTLPVNIATLINATESLRGNEITIANKLFFEAIKKTETYLQSFIMYSIQYIFNKINIKASYLFHLKFKKIAKNSIEFSYLADYFMIKNQYEHVIGLYDKLTSIDPFNASYWTNIAFCYRLIGYNESCITACNLALSINKKNAETLLLKAEALVDNKRYAEAQITYNNIKESFPELVNDNFQKNYILITLELHQYQAALELINMLDMSQIASVKLSARYYYETSQYDEALEVINKYLITNSNDYKALNLLGNTYLQFAESHIEVMTKEECLTNAYSAYKQSLEINNNQEIIYYQIGYTLFLQHNYQKSLKYLLESLKSYVSDSYTHFIISICFYHLGNLDKSQEYYRLAQGVENIHEKFLYYCPEADSFLNTITFE